MQTKTTAADLKHSISQLELKQAQEWVLLKETILHTSESLQPLNLIKSSLKNMITPSVVKENILDTSIGLTAGYLSKLLIVGVTHNPLRKLFGAFLQLGVTNIISKNANLLKPLAGGITKLFTKNKIANPENNSQKL